MIPSRIAGVLVASTLIAMFLACTGPQRVQYEPGTFRFDWSRHSSIEPVKRQAFRERFDRKVAALTAKLQDEAVLDALRASNQRDRSRTVADLMELDELWIQENGDELASKLVDERCSTSLRRLQTSFEGFAEIFVTNARGVNVCQTNKTSDYYQADETWWTKTWEDGRPWHDGLQYDDSAGVLGVGIYMAVVDPDTRVKLGIAKAVLEDKPKPRSF